MSLLDALLEPVSEKKRALCKLGRTIEKLDEPYKSALIGLVQNDGMNDHALSQRLHAAGEPVSRSIIYDHRRGVCACRNVVVE